MLSTENIPYKPLYINFVSLSNAKTIAIMANTSNAAPIWFLASSRSPEFSEIMKPPNPTDTDYTAIKLAKPHMGNINHPFLPSGSSNR